MRRRWLATFGMAVLLLMLTPLHARAAAGDGPGVGIWTPWWMGSYQIAGQDGYCIDPNGGPSETISGWRELDPQGARQQIGVGRAVGRTANSGREISAREWAEVAWLLDQVAAHRDDPVWTAVVDRLIRLRVTSDDEQRQLEQQRFEILLTKHPQARDLEARLADEVTRLAGPYTMEFTWVRQPSATVAGEATVRVVSGAGHPIDASVTVTDGGKPVKLAQGRVQIPAGAWGKHRLVATAEVPASVPKMLIPQHYLEDHPDQHGQRMVVRAPRGELRRELTADVSKLTPTIRTITSHTTAAPGAAIHDDIQVTGAQGYQATGTAILFGPYENPPTSKDCRPEDPRAGAVQFRIDGNGKVRTKSVVVRSEGYYTWQEILPATALAEAMTTPCGIAEETTRVTRPVPTPSPTPVVSATPTPTPTPTASPSPVVPPQQPVVRAGLGHRSLAGWLVGLGAVSGALGLAVRRR